MIYLNRPVSPYRLTKKRKRELIKIFIKSRQEGKEKSVWKYADFKDLKKSLNQMSHEKCAYCEDKLDSGGNMMEPDHFYPKERYPTAVVSWKNLLPSCKKCNSRSGKGNHDVKENPILDPSKLRPNQHFQYANQTYEIKGINELGIQTVKVLKLNDAERMLRKRKRNVDEMRQTVQDIQEELRARVSELVTNPGFREKIQRQTNGLLLKTTSVSAFSAVYATVLLHDQPFQEIRETLQQHGAWTTSMESKFEEAHQACFSIIIGI
ncbi:HNH endonuclease [Tumebacillus flagellatus]|uniref:HNH nuclease domain-containing protein n=1 Tax=Tumebacillus flagellatus TaxID=1157490 RepID=A0A074LTM9_9BACL|nr:HNH endonuclease [Tumebacillus flagellatus]KEO83148.1 hypothetical protein EL26_11810 [Tumebacillus flagellatus]